jgi:hypothetical protein
MFVNFMEYDGVKVVHEPTDEELRPDGGKEIY